MSFNYYKSLQLKLASHLYPLGILVALPQELQTLSTQKLALGEAFQLSDQIWIIRSGMGHQNALKASEVLIDKGVKSLVSWGTAGALNPKLQAGDLVLAEQVLTAHQERFFTEAHFRQEIAHILSSELNIYFGTLWASDTLVEHPQEKENLFQNYQVEAIDMESAALAKIAEAKAIPFAIIRAIVDTRDMKFPKVVSLATRANGEVDYLKFILYALLRPRDWPLIYRLAQAFERAKQSLKRVAQLLQP